MGLRAEKIAEEIQTLVATCFQGGQLHDPRLSGVTITRVRMSSDLQIAYVYFRHYELDAIAEAEVALGKAKGFFRNKLATQLVMRRVPELKFFYDEGQERANTVERLLHEWKNES